MVVPSYLPGYSFQCSDLMIIAYWFQDAIKCKNIHRVIDASMIDRNMDAGENPPDGVIIYYYLKQKPEGEVKLTFRTLQGEEIKSFTSEAARNQSPEAEVPVDPTDEEENREKKEPRVPKEAGTNRFIWNMRYPDPKKIDGYVSSEAVMSGPVAAPGIYEVQLT